MKTRIKTDSSYSRESEGTSVADHATNSSSRPSRSEMNDFRDISSSQASLQGKMVDHQNSSRQLKLDSQNQNAVAQLQLDLVKFPKQGKLTYNGVNYKLDYSQVAEKDIQHDLGVQSAYRKRQVSLIQADHPNYINTLIRDKILVKD